MVKVLKLKPVINKSNGQINVNLPRKKLSKKQLLEITDGKLLKIKLDI